MVTNIHFFYIYIPITKFIPAIYVTNFIVAARSKLLILQSNESSITQTLLNIIMSDSWRYVNLVMRQT